MVHECKTGCREYKVTLFQKNRQADLSSNLRANHQGTTDYHIAKVELNGDDLERGRHECAEYFLRQLERMPKFIHKLDAIIFQRGMQAVVYGMHRYLESGSSVDKVDAKLKGSDKEGYYTEFTPVRREGFGDSERVQ